MGIKVVPTLEFKLRAAAASALSGERQVFSSASGHCLQVSRELVSPALGYAPEQAWDFHAFYSKSRVPGNEEGTAWARSTQRTMRDVYGMQVPLFEVQVGDWLFNAAIDKVQGHVAVVVSVTASSVLILENTSTERGVKHDGYNRVTELSKWPYVEHVEAMRFKER